MKNAVTEEANMRPSKYVRNDERFLSLAQIGKLYRELK